MNKYKYLLIKIILLLFVQMVQGQNSEKVIKMRYFSFPEQDFKMKFPHQPDMEEKEIKKNSKKIPYYIFDAEDNDFAYKVVAFSLEGADTNKLKNMNYDGLAKTFEKQPFTKVVSEEDTVFLGFPAKIIEAKIMNKIYLTVYTFSSKKFGYQLQLIKQNSFATTDEVNRFQGSFQLLAGE